ncbi:MAG TPA: TIGR03905 family TSCPD domain-containing protein [Mobilitalea sp.]|nr:TIGR03905 family TSCPD domain-containing protein [Mobilitalea sp.]
MVYKTSGVCSRAISFEIDENTDTVVALNFDGGCSGNAGGISRLVVGMKVDDVIEKLEGVNCGPRATSCPDQLAKALKEWRSKK